MDLTLCRHTYADEIAKTAALKTPALKTPALIDALRTVPRERFLRPGPWLVCDAADIRTARKTPDADPSHVYHNCSIAIDAHRQLFNGAPGVVAASIDALRLRRGARVLHVGAGLGYYTAVIAQIVGEAGRVLAMEVDPVLATEASANLASIPWAEVRAGDAAAAFDEQFDAILVSAGVTHPLRTWLDALVIGGRIVFPLTVSMPVMGGSLGKGVTIALTKESDEQFAARVMGMTAIYSAVALRDDALNSQLGEAMMRQHLPPLARLRLDVHARGASCWLHSDRLCLSADAQCAGSSVPATGEQDDER
jgi:protein-L-isoaspartate(D-aspartate) O-methyltransferase